MGYPRFRRNRDFKFSTRLTNITVNSTTYINLDTALDLVIAARVDDYLELGMCGRWAGEATTAFIDAVSVVGGSPVNYMSGNGSTGEGVMGWQGYNGEQQNIGGGTFYKVVSGDRSGGFVTVRLRTRTGTATNKVFVGHVTRFWVKNLGPKDPN